MGIREYNQSVFDAVISLWQKCKLIESVRNATKDHLSTMSSRNKGLFLVYEDPSTKEIVGTVMGGWDGWRGWIYKLAVSPEHRRRGIGNELVVAVSDGLRKTGAGIIRAYIEKENEASLGLFRELGFVPLDDFVIVTQGRQQ